MLNTYIKNQGITKTIMHNNNNNQVSQINWDADYDGNLANISVNTNTNGKHNHYNITLDNEDLANILNVESVNVPLHKRLKNDFKYIQYPPEIKCIEFPTPKLEPREPVYKNELISRYISSPLPNEELIVPLTINKKKNRNLKTHITHRVYKKNKTSNKLRPISRPNISRSKSSRKKSSTINDFL
jgi:hypothetical protein